MTRANMKRRPEKEMKNLEKHVPSPKEIAVTARKSRLLGDNIPWMWRLFLPVQTRATRLLLRAGINSRQCTVLWLLTSLAGFGLTAVGLPWTFLLGAILVYLQQVLDGTDGEMGRYNKTFMTDEEDVRTHINGLYLDRVAHAINSSLWGLALACGLYRSTGAIVVVPAGIGMVVFHVVNRVDSAVTALLVKQFEGRVERVLKNGGFTGIDDRSAKSETLVVRLVEKIALWAVHGRRVNLWVLACSMVDIAFWLVAGDSTCPTLATVFVCLGTACPVLTMFKMWQSVRADVILRKVIRASDSTENQPEK